MKRALMSSFITTFVRPAFARGYIRVVGASRIMVDVISESTLPVLNLAAYVFTYRFLGAPAEYIGFVIVGGAALSFWMNVVWNMASQLYWEKESGNLEPIFISPASRMAILLGMAVGGFVNTTIRVTLTLVIGVAVFGVGFDPSGMSVALPIFLLTLVDLYSVGMMFSSLYLMYGREAWHLSALLSEPFMFLSGLYFPARFFPFWLQLIASAIPLTLGMDAVRRIFFNDPGLWELGAEVVALVVMAPVLVFIARRLLAKMEDLSKREGRLTLRWQ